MDDVYISDHLPIYVDCNVKTVRPKLVQPTVYKNAIIWGARDDLQTKRYRDICHERLRLIDFPSELIDCSFGICNENEHRIIIDQLYDDIIYALTSAAIQTNVKYKHKHYCKPRVLCGWNKFVKEAHQDARLKYKDWLLYNKPLSGQVYNDMRNSSKVYKGKLKWCKKKQDQLKMDLIAKHRMDKNFGDFWLATGKLDIKPGLPASVGGMTDTEKIANSFKEHFHVRSPLGPPSVVIDPESIVRTDEPLLRFTASQITAVIKGMSRGKSPGHDGISIEHLKNAGVHLPRLLTLLFNICISHSYLPTDLMKTIVVPIVKNRTGDIADMGNYRPISLATTIAKVLDSLLDSYLQKHLSIHDAQFGFRPGLSTESAILSLKYTVQYYTNRRTPVYACFLDLSKAFDHVAYEVLWGKLEDSGMPGELTSILKYWYLNQTNHVKWSNSLSEAYRLECGVRQGGLTSPKLFNLYVNELLAGLSSMRVGCKIGGVSVNNISYADDMVLLSPTISGIREMLGFCEAYATKHGLSYNVKKSEYMVFKAAGKTPENIPPIILNGMNINRVYQFKYLGHYLTDDFKDDVDIERERRALAVRGNMLTRRFASCTDLVKITLFKAYCQGMYTGNLWAGYAKRSLETLRVQYNNIFRMMLGLPRWCSASSMFAQAHTDGFHAVIRKKVASLVRRVRGSHNSILKIVAEDLCAPVMRHFVRVMVR